MALNPMLDNRNYPVLFQNEVIVIIYPGVYGNLVLNNGLKIRGVGKMFLSNARLVFVNNDVKYASYNFALHLNLISGERLVSLDRNFNYYEGYIVPYGNYMPAPGYFKIEMTQDPQPLLKAITNYLNQIRKANSAQAEHEKREEPGIHEGFVDPNDPDIIFIVDEESKKRG